MIRVSLLLSLLLFSGNLSSSEPFSFDPSKIPQLKKIGYADESGIVISADKVSIPGIPYLYNPSIISYMDRYIMAFRYDYEWDRKGIMESKIGLIELDSQFIPQESTLAFLDTGYINAEDPRLFKRENEYYVSYSKVLSLQHPIECCIGITQFDPETKEAIKSSDIMYRTGNMEKNWVPFIYKDDTLNEEKAYFMHRYAPQRVIELALPLNGDMFHVHESNCVQQIQFWQKKWGEIRGGTTPVQIGDEYLSFFHSSFVFNRIRYYVMGAITFDAKPPFALRKISPHPIFFQGIYSTPVTKNVWFYPRNNLRVIFPSGLVNSVEEEKEILYIFAGENDVAIRMIKIDKNALLDSLVDIHHEKNLLHSF